MVWVSINDGNVKAYELVNIHSARCKVGAICYDDEVGPVWSEKVQD